MKKQNKKGFTLAELLIVLAIIAILVAIMFPVFGAQLNKARATAELANVRAKYAELVADAMLDSAKTGDVSTVTISKAALEEARQDKTNTTITCVDGTPATTDAGGNPVAEKPGSITVDYKGIKGSFDTDGDVKFGA